MFSYISVIHTYIHAHIALTAAAAPTTSVYAQHEIVFRNSNCLINRQEEGPADDDGLLELESFEVIIKRDLI